MRPIAWLGRPRTHPLPRRVECASLGCCRSPFRTSGSANSPWSRAISEHGLGGRASLTPKIGERLLVAIPGHRRLMGTVRWCEGDRFGVLTDHPIQIDDVRTANGDRLSTLDDRPGQFEILQHRHQSTYRPSLNLGQPKTTATQVTGSATRYEEAGGTSRRPLLRVKSIAVRRPLPV